MTICEAFLLVQVWVTSFAKSGFAAGAERTMSSLGKLHIAFGSEVPEGIRKRSCEVMKATIDCDQGVSCYDIVLVQEHAICCTSAL